MRDYIHGSTSISDRKVSSAKNNEKTAIHGMNGLGRDIVLTEGHPTIDDSFCSGSETGH